MPGKFDSELSETLYLLTLDGTCESFGDVEAPCGHVSIVLDYCAADGEPTDFAADGDYLVIEDSFGFVSIEGPFDEVAIDAGGYFSPVERRAGELRSLWDAWLPEECIEPGCTSVADEEHGGRCEECASDLAAAELADRRRYSPTFADEVRASEIMGTAFGPAE